MKWFRKKPKPLDFEIIRRDIPLSQLARWYMYDTELAEPAELAEILGMNPDSEEGMDKEREDSDIRMSRIEYLMPFLHTMSEIAADTITGIQINEIINKNPDAKEEIERESDTMRTMYKVIALAAMMGAFSSAAELSLIEPGDIQNMEEGVGWFDE